MADFFREKMVFVAKLEQVIFEPNQRVAIGTNTVTQVWCMGVMPPMLARVRHSGAILS